MDVKKLVTLVAHAIGKRVACSAVFGPVTAEEQLILQGTMKLMSL